MAKRGLSFEPIWADSLGAKTSCTLVETPDVKILIDPGAAVMQPSFPASWAKKLYWEAQAMRKIKRASRRADVVVISHYHYDHFTDFDRDLYKDKLLLVKNPNEYINDSQRKRAEHFFGNICKHFGDTKLEGLLRKREHKKYGDPLEQIPRAREKDFGDYNSRRRELFRKGQKWFRNRVKNWNSKKVIPELKLGDLEVKFAEDRELKLGRTKLRFTRPLFHGIEFSRVGWVFATIIEYGKEKLIHSSDLDGPIIEDYADWIIQEKPNVLFLDGPLTYMLGYLTSKITLNRTIENATRIVEKARTRLMFYDHHLPREPRFRERTAKVWETAKERRKKLLTVAEFLGKKPVVLK